jgi:DNA-directed RNA polymerase specialized sigma subunit
MGKKIDKVTGEIKYSIPIDGKYYETTEEIYKAYFQMERRERYLEERSEMFDKSYEELVDSGFSVEGNLFECTKLVEDDAIEAIMIEKMLAKLTVLSEYEMWLIQELYLHGKSERELEKESDIPRRTIGYQRKRILNKLRIALEE